MSMFGNPRFIEWCSTADASELARLNELGQDAAYPNGQVPWNNTPLDSDSPVVLSTEDDEDEDEDEDDYFWSDYLNS